MSQPGPHLAVSPLLKHRLTIFLLGLGGAAIAQALQLGFIPTGIASAAGALLGEILTYEQSQPVQ